MSKNRTIVLGGARSGKSAFAERLVNNSGKPKIYLATAEAHDVEMQTRIAQHRESRGAGWITTEAALTAADALRNATGDQVVLLDCATIWLSNQLMAGHDLARATDDLLAALDTSSAEIIIVSNEVGYGIVPDNAMARTFRDAQGRLNQQIASICDLAVLVVAGLPLVLKGTLPTGFQ